MTVLAFVWVEVERERVQFFLLNNKKKKERESRPRLTRLYRLLLLLLLVVCVFVYLTILAVVSYSVDKESREKANGKYMKYISVIK